MTTTTDLFVMVFVFPTATYLILAIASRLVKP